MRSQYRPEIVAAAKNHGLDPVLIEAVVWQESGDKRYAFRYERHLFESLIYGNRKAKAGMFGPLAACSYGLMQILLETAAEEGFDGPPEELFDVTPGLDAGCKHLARLLAWAKGNEHQALAAYNGGMGAWNTPGPEAYAGSVAKWKGMLT